MQWADRVKASTRSLCDLNVDDLHSILSKEKIKKYINYAVFNTEPSVLIDIVDNFIGEGLGKKEKNVLENFFLVIERVIWSLGNSIPGPDKIQRIDLDQGYSNFEKPLALESAYGYAKNIESSLIALEESQSFQNWMNLVNLTSPLSPENIAAQEDIIQWADAWATDEKYRIYIRLSKDETLEARKTGQLLECGAWVFNQHPRLLKVVDQLDSWSVKINHSNGNDLIYVVEKMRKEMNCDHSEKWLNRHNKN